jgi:hypothetical protein
MPSPVRSPPRTPTEKYHLLSGDGDQETFTTPPGTDIEDASDVTPKQNISCRMEGQSARDVGLRAMDYLSSRSSLQQLQARELAENKQDGKGDLSAASPYGVD